MTTCKSCGASIIWVTTEKGKKMPLNEKSALNGNIILMHKKVRDPPIARYQNKREEKTRDDKRNPDAARTRYVSHFVTCPQAKGWRKKKK